MSSEYSGILSNESLSTHAEQLEARATVDTVVPLTCEKMWKEAETIF